MANVDGSSYVLRGADAVLPDRGVTAADIVVEDGKIAAILDPGSTYEADDVDVSGLTIFPGVIDPHIHLGHGNDISRPRVPTDAETETAAAVRGGVTAFVSYVISADPYEEFFDEMVSVAEAGARIDFGFHFVISTEAQLTGLPRYIGEYGVPTAKLFMNIRQDEGQRLGLPGIDDGFAYRLLEQLHKHGGMLCPHPENIEIGWVLTDRAKAADPEGTGGLATWNDARPPMIEAEAIKRISYLGKQTGTPVYCVHTSSAAALEAAREARAEGCPTWVETCTQYLTHDVDSPVGDVGKINPPLRKSEDRAALWEGLKDGFIDTVATDHVHRTAKAKEGGIWKASPGCPGMDTLLPVMISEGYHKHGLPLERIAELCSANPARLMGLGDRKGRIAEGLDADLAIVDLNARYTVGRDTTETDAGYSLYDGQELTGRVCHVVSRGGFALRDGALVPEAVGRGRYLPRKLENHT